MNVKWGVLPCARRGRWETSASDSAMDSTIEVGIPLTYSLSILTRMHSCKLLSLPITSASRLSPRLSNDLSGLSEVE